MEVATAKRHAPRGPILAKDHIDGPDHKDYVTCSATSKGSRKRCKRRPIPGGTVCVKHGGGAPQVQEAAKARLLKLQHPAIDALQWLITQREFPSAAMSAARDVMDRTEGKAPESVDLRVSGEINVVEVLRQRHLRSRNIERSYTSPQAGDKC